MFVLLCDITIGSYRFRQVNEITVSKSWRKLGDTCTIKLPKYVRSDKMVTNTLDSFIKVGDPVIVKMKYLGLVETTEFEGTVSKIKPNIPFEIECEDSVWYMKRTPLRKSWSIADKATLKEVVTYLVSEVNSKHKTSLKVSGDIPTVNFTEGFVIESGNNAATALESIRENFGLASYFKGTELFTGLSYQKTYGTAKHSLAWNVIESDLAYRKEEDTQIRIKPIGIKKDNTKVETSTIVGDEDGELRTVHYYNVTTESELLKLAKNDLEKYKFEGFEGDFTTFLYPYAEPLMITELQDPRYDEARSGSYIIDSVTTTFGVSGARRVVKPGIKVSA